MKQAQVVVITGASAGVGRATARAFAKRGAKLALIARGIDGLEATRREVEERGGSALVIPLDVSDSKALDDAATRVEREFGPIDVWVNNAMVSVFSPVKLMKPEEYLRVTEVTYLGYVYGTLSALRRMLKRDRGTIIQVSSALGYRSIPLQSAYCAAKHAIVGFTESLRTELLHDRSRVRVTLVNLPAVNTPQFGWVKNRLPRKPQPVPPIFQPEVPARAVVYASRHPRKSLDVAFPSVKAILAEKLAPGLADRYLADHAYESQQTEELADPRRPDNVWTPVSGDPGCHGSFDERARSFSWQVLWTENRAKILALLVPTVAVAVAALRSSRGSSLSRSSSRPLSRSSRPVALREPAPRRNARPASL